MLKKLIFLLLLPAFAFGQVTEPQVKKYISKKINRSYQGYDLKNTLNLMTTYSAQIEAAAGGVSISNLATFSDTLSNANRKSNTLFGIIDKYTGEQFSMTKTTVNYSNVAITDADVDNVIYFKKSGEYFRRNYTGNINVKWFGATGNGATDDTEAIRQAMLSSRRLHLFFPRGVYRLTSSINMPANFNYAGTKISGESGIGQGSIAQGTSVILVDGAFEGITYNKNPTATLFHGIEVSNLHFKGGSAGNAKSGLSTYQISNTYIHRCTFSDFPKGAGLIQEGSLSIGKIQYGIISDCHFGRDSVGLRLVLANGWKITNNYFDGADNTPGVSNGSGGHTMENLVVGSIGIDMLDGDTNIMLGNTVQFYYTGVKVDRIGRFESFGTRFEGCPTYGFNILNSPEFRIYGGSMTNYIIGCGIGTGVNWDNLSINGVIDNSPMSCVVSAINGNGDLTYTYNVNGTYDATEFKARTRFYAGSFIQSPEIRSISGTTATTDAKITMGGAIQLVRNISGVGTLASLKHASSGATGNFIQAQGASNDVRWIVDINGKMMVRGATAPTASLHLGANANGSAGGAHIKMEPSTLLTTIENNAIEYDGNHLYMGIGGLRRQLDQQFTKAAASADVATAPSATYTQAEVQAILTELRDLKAKLRTANILTP